MSVQSTTPGWEQLLFALSQDAPFSGREPDESESSRQHTRLESAKIAICEAITAEYSRSFHLATRLLPAEKRRAMRVLYAFCRTADNVADGNVDQPEARLREIRQGIKNHHDVGSDPVLSSWAAIQAQYRIPLAYAEQLLDGVERDLVQQRYRTFEDLSVYCYGVASTVGLMSMHITGYSDSRAIPYAIKLGVALQLTNILRDVWEDWNAGRLYLPLDELACYGLDEGDVSAADVNDRWRSFMRFQIERARRMYAEAMPGISLLHPDSRFAVAAALLLYQGILDDIEAHDYNIFHRRAYVGRWRKLAILIQAFGYVRRSTHLALEV